MQFNVWRALAAATFVFSAAAPAEVTQEELDGAARKIESRVIEWRRDFHQHPELSNREVRTAEVVAKRLRSLGWK